MEMVLHEIGNAEIGVSNHPVGWQLDNVEKAHIRRALQHFGNNLTHTAKALGISLNTLKAKIKKLHPV
jgi:DNA-binding NtrC family response regulator